MREKGIKILVSIFLFASILMPFSVYADEQTLIVPTWNWGSQYSNQFTVTNFCEGSGTSVSCELRFTANNSYYGYLSFDGYNGTTKWIDYKNVWIADGYGAYRYSLYQNGVIQINKINIEGGFIKSSMDNLDLQDIIDILTAIETDSTSIDNQLNTELQRLQSIINNQIIQNGYLETLTKLRQWNIPIESYNAVIPILNQIQPININSFSYFNYPIFNCDPSVDLFKGIYTNNTGFDAWIVMLANADIYELSRIPTFFSYNSNAVLSDYLFLSRFRDSNNTWWYLFKFKVHLNSNSTEYITFNTKSTFKIIPIYFGWVSKTKYMSIDFALNYGFSNQLIDDLHLIAQGTQQSNSAASGLESSNSTMASDMNSMATIENGYSQNFNSQLQNIDFTNPIQQNQGILPAANFVISIFNGLISNNPFTVLIIIVCILLIGKKVIGK